MSVIIIYVGYGFNFKCLTRKHQSSRYHQDAVMKSDDDAPHQDVAEMLSHSHAIEKEQNRKMLMTIVESLQFLARQSIAIRGHDDKESNFFQLLNLRSCDNKVRHE